MPGCSPDMLLQVLGDDYDIYSDNHITHTVTQVYKVSFRLVARKKFNSAFVARSAHAPK